MSFKEEIQGVPKILFSRISPPVFIDSRKTARKSKKCVNFLSLNSRCLTFKQIDPYIDLFDPSILNQKFSKKVSKKDSNLSQGYSRDIDNSLWGLHDYLTAANIRNKSKHLLFLAMRFTSCLDIYISNNFGDLTVSPLNLTFRLCRN